MSTTSVKLASRIARHLEMDENAKQRLHRSFRNMITRGIVPGDVDPDDARGTILLGDNAAATAVLLLPLADLAVDARGLREVSDALLRPDLLADEKLPPIVRAIGTARAGDDVTLLVELFWSASSASVSRKVRLVFAQDESSNCDEDDTISRRVMQNWRDAFTVELARIEVPASTWLRMYLADDVA